MVEEEQEGVGVGEVGGSHCRGIIGHPLWETGVWWRKLGCFIRADVALSPSLSVAEFIFIAHSPLHIHRVWHNNKNSDANSSAMNDERTTDSPTRFYQSARTPGTTRDLC